MTSKEIIKYELLFLNIFSDDLDNLVNFFKFLSCGNISENNSQDDLLLKILKKLSNLMIFCNSLNCLSLETFPKPSIFCFMILIIFNLWFTLLYPL